MFQLSCFDPSSLWATITYAIIAGLAHPAVKTNPFTGELVTVFNGEGVAAFTRDDIILDRCNPLV